MTERTPILDGTEDPATVARVVDALAHVVELLADRISDVEDRLRIERPPAPFVEEVNA